jgi:hypothetical protein
MYIPQSLDASFSYLSYLVTENLLQDNVPSFFESV